MNTYDLFFDRVLTRVDAERAHHLAFRGLRLAGPALGVIAGAARMARAGQTGPVEALGLRFANPLGLAAGFDKNAVGIDALAALGFGHVEVGTVTALPQPGNPTPRLFRLPEDRAIVNRMGFNNDGAEVVAARLARRSQRGTRPVVLGVNIGKSKVVPEEDQAAVEADYRTSARLLAPYADYLVLNVSSPNTPGLRSLQAVERLGPLLAAVRGEAGRVPLCIKIAPDLADEDVCAVADLAVDLGVEGLIATNTTIARDGLVSAPGVVAALGAGGLSGQPLTARSLAVLRLLADRVGSRVSLIGVGGIGSVADAQARLDAGAKLVQAYSGFVYGGPAWPRRIVRGLAAGAPR